MSDISYTRAPEWVKQIPGYEHDKCSTFATLSRLAYPEDRAKNLGNALASPQHHAVLDPAEQMLCYYYLYYACAAQVSFWWRPPPLFRLALSPSHPNTISRTRRNGRRSARTCTGRP